MTLINYFHPHSSLRLLRLRCAAKRREKLAKNFNVENKGIFPYNFLINTNNQLLYKGDVPDIKYFNDISDLEYQEYSNKFTSTRASAQWDLKNETIKYCLQDCISLYQVIMKFH